MRPYRLATLLVVTGFIVSAIVAGPAAAIPLQASVRAQEVVEPQLVFTALQLADHVRYAVTLVRPLSTTVANVRVEVSLPAGADLTETLQTPNRSVFIGVDGNVLSWGAPSYEPGDPVDAFTFRVARPLNGEAHIRASWEVEGQPRAAEIRAAPEVQPATAAAGEVILQSGLETASIGETGVQLSVDPEAGLDGVRLRVRKLGADANPPAGVGSPWWCAMLGLEGLPDGASVFAFVPSRQPLPPGARVDLFVERAGAWQKLDDQGHATADGQFVAFRHPGGAVAAGVTTIFQPSLAGPLVGGVAQAPPSRPSLRVSIQGPSTLQSPSSPVYRISVSNVGAVAAQQVGVVITDSLLTPIAISDQSTSPGGFACVITRRNAFSDLEGQCVRPSLAGGSSATILVTYRTHDNFQGSPMQGSLKAKAVDNYVRFVSTVPSTSHEVSFPITILPVPSGA